MRTEETGMNSAQKEVASACEQLHGLITKAYWNFASDEIRAVIRDCEKEVHDLWISVSSAVSGAAQTVEESTASARSKLLRFLNDKRIRDARLDAGIRKLLVAVTNFLASPRQNSHRQ